MPAGLGRFQRRRLNTGDPLRDVWAALEHAERHLSLLPGTPAVQVDEDSGALVFPDGTAPPGLGGGGEDDGGGATHSLFSPMHSDTEPGDPAAGDIGYFDGAVWQRLPIGSTGEVLTVAGGLPDWGAAVGSYPIGVWADDDVTNLTTSYVEQETAWSMQVDAVGDQDFDTIPHVMPDAGVATKLTIDLTGDVGGVGDDVIAELFKNGSPTGLICTVSGGAGTEQFAKAVGSVVFADQDKLTVHAKKAGSPGTNNARFTVWGRLNS
jgi:hypothetical protein